MQGVSSQTDPRFPAAAGTILEGYSDELSALPGEIRTFHVSTSLPSYAASIVRLQHGDVRGPGYRAETVADLGILPGSRQELRRGSSVAFDGPIIPAASPAFTVTFWIYAHTPSRPWQGLFTQWDLALGCSMGLFIGADHRVVLRLAEGDVPVGVLDAGDVLWRDAWTFVAATVDRVAGEAHLYVRRDDEQEMHHVTAHGFQVSATTADVPWRLGAYATAGEPCGFYNGKIGALALCGRALTPTEVAQASRSGLAGFSPVLGAWDFAKEAATERVVDVSGQERHGRTLHNPTRGVTDHTFVGPADLRWSTAPWHYNAIEFHDDDLDDARWHESFSWRVPEDLRSGLYAAHLTGAGVEAFLPFVVRAPAHRRSPIAMIVPTFTWQAYLAQRPAYNPHDDGVPNCMTTRRAPLRNPWWGNAGPKSYYDYTRGAHLAMADLYLIEWLDSQGFAFDALTDNDLHAAGAAALAGHRVVVLSAHPEYYSGAMLDALQAHVDGGGRLMYLGGNGLFWVTSVAPGRPHLLEIRRSGVVFEDWVLASMLARPGEREHIFGAEMGGMWRDCGRPPNRLLGIGFCSQGGWPGTGYRLRVDPTDPRISFIFAGVTEELIGDYGLNSGGAAGHEFDRFDPDLGAPAETIVLATADTTGHPRWETAGEYLAPGETRGDAQRFWHADMVFYELPSGGAVFSAGSITWTGSLSHRRGDNDVARITRNVLTRFMEST